MEVITIKTRIFKYFTIASVIAVLCVAITICIIAADKQPEGSKIVFIKSNYIRSVYK